MKEQISALMDDEYEPDQAAHLLQALRNSPSEAAESWATYHLIGDVLRGDASMPAGFSVRLMARLDTEPTVLAPRRRVEKPAFWMSAAAGVAAIAFVGWMVWPQVRAPQAEYASAPLAQNAGNSPQTAQNDVSPESVSSYLVAHQSTFSGGGMQAAYYVRPAEVSESGR